MEDQNKVEEVVVEAPVEETPAVEVSEEAPVEETEQAAV